MRHAGFGALVLLVGLSGCSGDQSSPSDGATGPGSGGASTGPSCIDLPATCGASAKDNCCDSINVPAGSFRFGSSGSSEPDACPSGYQCVNPTAAVDESVSAFRLDRFEVTVGRFRSFVRAVEGGFTPEPSSGKHSHLRGGAGLEGETGWDPSWPALPKTAAEWNTLLRVGLEPMTWTPDPGPNEARPINWMTWYVAYAFCIWDGGFLPTEAEWEYAASGGEERQFPWSAPPSDITLTPEHANYRAAGAAECLNDGVAGCAATDLLPVGTKPSGNARWGQADLGGNVEEWTLDWFWYDLLACADCAHTAQFAPQDPYHVVRGGSYDSQPAGLLVTARNVEAPHLSSAGIGMRCARAP